METIEFTVAGNLTLRADIHLATAARRERVVLYFHGGGLLCGTRDDLPLPYIRELNAQGYDLICFDYPLAPESSLAEIHEAVYGCLTWSVSGAAAGGQNPAGGASDAGRDSLFLRVFRV